MLHAVQAALEKAFPDCNDLSNISESGFSPHLSVGQFPKVKMTLCLNVVERSKEIYVQFPIAMDTN